MKFLIFNLKFLVKSKCLNFKSKIALIILATCYLSLVTSIQAQTVDPATWQNNSVGLKTTSNSDKKTAGLGIIVKNSDQTSWPFLSLQGGIKNSLNKIVGPIGIEMGNIKIPNTSAVSNTEVSDWAHDELNYNSSALKLTVSRLTSAILAQTNSNNLRLFSGNLAGNTFNGTTVTARTASPSFPKYVAYSTAGGIQVKSISTTSVDISNNDKDWVLIWYGNNSHFVDTKKPLTYSELWSSYPEFSPTMPMTMAYQADAPMLLTFQNKPASIVRSSEGGIDLTFSAASNQLSILPLFGREHPTATSTESWSTGIPANVLTRVNFWAQRTCDFPVDAAESYGYNPTTDTTTVSENITYTQICLGGTKFAPVPPMLGVAKTTLPIQFSQTVSDGQLPTEFGPSFGIDNATTYSWSLAGLNKYVNFTRPAVNPAAVPANFLQELTTQVDLITSTGHFIPWLFEDRSPSSVNRGEYYWGNPADTLSILTEIIPVLPEPQKTNLTDYLKSEKANYPPDTVFDLSITQGASRGDFAMPSTNQFFNTYKTNPLNDVLTRVPTYSFYALSSYYTLTGEAVPASVLTNAKTALNKDYVERDWANFSNFKGYSAKRPALENINRNFMGVLGVVRIAKTLNDTSTEAIARGLLAKETVARVGAAKFPQYLYSSGLTDLSGLPTNWMSTQTARNAYGHLYNNNWTTAADDARQVALLNQFETYLYDHSGFDHTGIDYNSTVAPHIITFRDLGPEGFALLNDYAKAESINYINKIESFIPGWYMAFHIADFGLEHGLNHPTDSHQTFMGKALIQGETAQNLATYASFPWLAKADLFYVQKLAETARVYAATGVPASPTPTPTPTPTPSPSPSTPGSSVTGDISGITGVPDNKVDIWDYNKLLSDFGMTGTNLVSDIEKAGTSLNKVDIFDYNLLLSNFGSSGSSPAPSSTPSSTPISNLVARWKMDEGNLVNDCLTNTVMNSAGSGLNFKSCPSGSGATANVAGKFSNAVSLDGVNDYLSAGVAPSSVLLNRDFSISAWVNTNSSATQYILSAGGSNWTLFMDAARKIRFDDANQAIVLSSASTINSGTWYHVAVTVDNASPANVKLYINGVLDASTTTTRVFNDGGTSNHFTMGAANSNGIVTTGTYFNGKLDEVRIYNKALSQSEVTSLVGNAN